MKNLSICIIAKNEESNIANCISAIHESLVTYNYTYEICLVDTGSTDKTVEIALAHNATVHNYTWQNDFSAARNYASSVAEYEYILFVDSDEILENCNWTEVFSLLDKYPKFVGMITRRNLCNSGDSTAITVDKVARLFDRRLYHYELSIHEQLVANNNSMLNVYDIPLSFYHEGYMGTPEQLAAKAKRNNDLLFKELKHSPDDPYIYFQIAQSYSLMNDSDNQYIYYQKAYNLSPDINDIYTTDLILSLGYSYITKHEYDKALSLYNKHYKELHHLADFLCFGAYAHIKAALPIDAISICKEAISANNYRTEGSNNTIPYYYLGCIYETYENIGMANKYFSLANHYSDADTRLSVINKKLSINVPNLYKKISVIITPSKIHDIDKLMNTILDQTMDINNIEIIFIGSLSRYITLSDWESSYPDSIMLINISEELCDAELINIALEYVSGEYINIYNTDYVYNDGLRHLYLASHNEQCDIGVCDITYGDESDYYININSAEEASAIINANILHSSTNNKIYARNTIIKNNLDYSRLLNNDALIFAKTVYCSKKKLL